MGSNRHYSQSCVTAGTVPANPFNHTFQALLVSSHVHWSAGYWRCPSADLRCLFLCRSVFLWCCVLRTLDVFPSQPLSSFSTQGVYWLRQSTGFLLCIPELRTQGSELRQFAGHISSVLHLRYDSPSLFHVQCLKNILVSYILFIFCFCCFRQQSKSGPCDFILAGNGSLGLLETLNSRCGNLGEQDRNSPVIK